MLFFTHTEEENNLKTELKDNNDYSDEEMTAESELLIANDWILPVYKKAKELKTVIIVSDMYLPEEFIADVLKREGFNGYKKLYLSSSVNKTKSSGELFDYVLSEIGKEKRILHIGDSYISDFLIPNKKGIDAIHIPTDISNKVFRLRNHGIESNIINSFLNNTFQIFCSL